MRRLINASIALGILTAALSPVLPAQQARPAAGAQAVAPPDARFNGFDEYVRSIMEEFHVPGLAVAAVHNGEIVLMKGYGHRNVAERLPMTPRTLLAIGSNSKSFTAMLLGILVEEGKLAWDEPLRNYLPDFHLHDEAATAAFTPRDLVIHRSGLPRHDLLWYGRSYTRQDLYERLRHLEPTTSFRGRWQYQNLMFLTAGVLAERLTGMPWEELVRRRIFQPLAMTRSNLSVTDMPSAGDYASPYAMVEEEVRPVPFRNIDAVGPAGSINSSVEEMIRYVEMNINQGEYRGTRIISEKTAQEMQRPQSVTPAEWEHPELGYSSYGLGLAITAYHGKKVVLHGGGIDGFISAMSWMPQEKIGVVVLTNFSGFNPVPSMVQWNVYDRLLGVEPVDWLSRAREDRQEFEENQAKQRRERQENRKEGTAPSHTLADYIGRYEHPAYGTVEITLAQDSLTLALDGFGGRLRHYHYDMFEIDTPPPQPLDEMLVTFLYDKKGEIDRLLIPLEPTVADIVFTKEREEESESN
jgi:CubicO group peptidase (beta-lactamase class C family)